MKIAVVKNKTGGVITTLVDIWERSVKATHVFLTRDEIARIKKYVPHAISEVENLIIAEVDGTAVAFAGVENKKIEMLFVAPEFRGKRVGKSLVNYAANSFNADTVTVNEQNPQAVGFYEHLGFAVYKRTDFDEQGNPYPLLYMKLICSCRFSG